MDHQPNKGKDRTDLSCPDTTDLSYLDTPDLSTLSKNNLSNLNLSNKKEEEEGDIQEAAKKSIEDLQHELHEIEQGISRKPRVLKSDGEGNLLLDPNNSNDVEWYENDAAYDVVQLNAFEQAKATIELEGFKVTAEDEKIIKAVSTGKMTRDQLIKSLENKK